MTPRLVVLLLTRGHPEDLIEATSVAHSGSVSSTRQAYKTSRARRNCDPLRWAQAFALLLELRGVRRGQGARNDLTSDTMSEVAAEVGADLRMAERRLAQFDQFVELPEALQTAVLAGTISLLEAQRQVVHAAHASCFTEGRSRRDGIKIIA
jgi:hypothetical protein